MPGRSIRIHLADGTPKGVRVAQSPVRTCMVAVTPTKDLGAVPELVPNVRGPGIYFLVSDDPNDADRFHLYIGESEDVYQRVKRDHLPDKNRDFQQVVFVLSTSDFLTKAHVTWLERRFISIIKAAGLASIDNDNKGRTGNLPRADEDDLETFLSDVRMMLPVLGFSFARDPVSKPRPVGEESVDSPVFEFSTKGASATMQVQDGEFVVFKGSTACVEGTESWDSYKGLHKALVTEGKLVPSNDPRYYDFAESVPFKSPSAAAAIVAAANQAGPQVWKVQATGQSYREWEEERVAREAGGQRTAVEGPDDGPVNVGPTRQIEEGEQAQ
jgi:hypothetical protein